MHRIIEKVIQMKPAIEGAGVRLHRGFGYYELPQFDPFLLFDDFSGEHKEDYIAGFPWHPHRGIETVTYMLEGEVKHKDSLGNEGVIGAGDLQWMSAGSGIIHEEMPQESRAGIRGFQLWVNLPAEKKMSTPQYQEVRQEHVPMLVDGGITVKVIAGEYKGTRGSVADIAGSPTYLDVALAPETAFDLSVPEEDTLFIYVIEGDVVLKSASEQWIRTHEIGLTSQGDTLTLRAGKEGARFLVVSGTPLKEPIAWHGPIVMNTQEEIQTALAELQNGTFVK